MGLADQQTGSTDLSLLIQQKCPELEVLDYPGYYQHSNQRPLMSFSGSVIGLSSVGLFKLSFLLTLALALERTGTKVSIINQYKA